MPKDSPTGRTPRDPRFQTMPPPMTEKQKQTARYILDLLKGK